MDLGEILASEEVGPRRKVGEMCCGITVYRQGRSLILVPDADLRVLHTGYHNSGFMQSPAAIVNTTSMGNRVETEVMGRPLSVNDWLTVETLRGLGLDPDATVAFGTAAHMDNAAICNAVSEVGVKVSAAVTGGVRGNGGRAGDPASYDEAARAVSQRSGTIVIVVAVEARLSDGELLEAVLSATQAKSRVLQELMARSLYSEGVATGSGTDQTCVVCLSSGAPAHGAGPTTDLGRAVAGCVREALERALDLQSGMNPATQRDPFVMLSRFGITAANVHDEVRYPATMVSLLEAEARLRRDPGIAAAVSAALNVEDQVRLGYVTGEEGMAAVRAIVAGTILEEGDVDPVSRAVMDTIEDIPGYVSMVLALALRREAARVQGVT